MTASKEMLEAKKELQELGHDAIVPDFTEEYAQMNTDVEAHAESAKNKVRHGLIKGYFGEIQSGDAVLIINKTRRGINNYIGGNSFLEMGFAHVLNKKIFLFNPIPNMIYKDELMAMEPTVLNGDLTKIQ